MNQTSDRAGIPEPFKRLPWQMGRLARRWGATHSSAMETFSVTLNGEPRRLDGPANVASLLAQIGLDARKVAVERNEAIVPRSAYDRIWLAEGDALEIVHFIGGG